MSSEKSQETLQQSEANNAGLPPSKGWHKTFSALRNPNYRYFYSGQTVSLIGTWTRTAALGWVTFQFTHSEFLLGIVFMLNSLPIFLFAVYAGSLAVEQLTRSLGGKCLLMGDPAISILNRRKLLKGPNIISNRFLLEATGLCCKGYG